MKYGRIEKISLFNDNAGGGQITLTQYAAGAPPAVPIKPDGTNLYVDAGLMVQAGGILLADHQAVILDVVANAANGFLNLGLEPTTAFDNTGNKIDGASPAQLHGYVAQNLAAIQTFFRAIDALISNGLTVVVRYASEFNGDNPYSRDPASFKAAIAVVKQAAAGTRIKLVFSPAVNEAEGEWNAATVGQSISAYWIDDFFDVVSCTLYARPQSADETEDDAVKAAVTRLAGYLTNVSAPMAGFDEFGASSTFDGNAAIQGNDLALQKLLNAINDNAPLSGLNFNYATLFLQNYWGKDATLEWLVQDNAGA